MSNLAISIENLSKQYRLGMVGARTLKDDMSRWIARIRGKEDPTLRIGAENRLNEVNSPYVWALRDINLELKQGEVLGVIGKNGAGKSTLLKILSKVTAPTLGQVRIKGRVASLLEVGTGFHPELTGRENIFLNGAILGMTKNEIRQKFDEIVSFSGIEKYVDTPVKRYSSGMYVRLAFAVAAHLEPEILIVDEVLAVGDADFQKKAIGKMKDVTTQGRTILFVSHNMTAIQSLCNRGVLLRNGMVAYQGEVDDVINQYLSREAEHVWEQQWNEDTTAPGNENIKVKRIVLSPLGESQVLDVRSPLKIECEFNNLKAGAILNLSMHLYALSGECIFNIVSDARPLPAGIHKAHCIIPGNFLNDGNYTVNMMFIRDTSVLEYNLVKALSFEVKDYRENLNWYGKWHGAVRPLFIPFVIDNP